MEEVLRRRARENPDRHPILLVGKHQDKFERRGPQGSVLLLGRFPVDRMPSNYAHAGALLVSLKKRAYGQQDHSERSATLPDGGRAVAWHARR